MSWTYDPKLASSKDKVRFLIDDTDDLDQLLQDEEIEFALGQFGNIFRAASALCETLAIKFAKQVGVSGGVNWDPAKQAEKYRELAKSLKVQASEAGNIGLFAGGLSVSGKRTQESDADRVAPSFTTTQHSNPGTTSTVDPFQDSV